MHRLAIEPAMLARPTDHDLRRFKQDGTSRQQAQLLLDNRRKTFVNLIKAERERIRTSPVTESRSVSSMADLSSSFRTDQQLALARIERAQKREIEQIVIAELTRVRDQYRAEFVQNRHSAIREQKEREQAAERARDAERRRQREDVLRARAAAKSALLEQRRLQQDAASMRSQQQLAEKKAAELKRTSDADKERQARAEQIRLEIERKRAEERRRLVAKMRAQEIKEAHMMQRKQEQIAEIRERNAAKSAETQHRFAVSKARAIKTAERKRCEMIQKDVEAEIRIQNITRERDARIVGKQRAKSAAQAERYAAASKVIAGQRRSKKAAMARKELQADERKREIIEERWREVQDMEENRLQRLNRAQETVANAQKERARKGERAREKWERDDEHTEQTKLQRDWEIHDRAELQKLREELQAENAERVRRMREMHMDEKSEESQERQARALVYCQNQQTLALRKREQKIRLDFEKAALVTEFRDKLRKKGRINVELLARQFGLDLDELRKKVGK
jgi:hypothetical protein